MELELALFSAFHFHFRTGWAILVCCIFAPLHPKYHMHLDQRIFQIFVAVLFRFYAEFLKWKDQFSCIGFFSLSPFFKLQICCGKIFWRRQSRASKFPFLSTIIVSYKSWHLQLKFETLLRLLRSKFGPLEVAEVAKVQTRKNVSHFLKSSIFEEQKCNVPQKKAENNCHWYLKQN